MVGVPDGWSVSVSEELSDNRDEKLMVWQYSNILFTACERLKVIY